MLFNIIRDELVSSRNRIRRYNCCSIIKKKIGIRYKKVAGKLVIIMSKIYMYMCIYSESIM